MENKSLVEVKCPVCKAVKFFYLDTARLKRYRAGEHVQNVFPELNSEDRERLITGLARTAGRKYSATMIKD